MIRAATLGIILSLFAELGSAQKPSFEVVSIKPNQSGDSNGSLGPRGSRLVGTNVTLITLLLYAFSRPEALILEGQIVGQPGWARTDHFDIEAKAEGDARILPGEQTKAMVRSLLEDSFQLRTHKETRELPVYNLVLTKSGPKLSQDQTPLDPRQGMITFVTEGSPLGPLARGTLRMIGGPHTTVMTGAAISIPRMVEVLQGRADHLIVDKTGFTGLIDVQLTFSHDLAADPPGALVPDQTAPSLFTAIQDVGLKLEAAKAPVPVLVVDRVQRPPQN